MSRLAPIVLFVYDRPDHTSQTLEALSENDLASESSLFIYSDAPQNESSFQQVEAVRQLAHSAFGFKSVKVIERETNYGLARNIIEGVTQVCNREGRVIVLEDDIVTSPCFLKFMNAALDRYANNSEVWHISGWNYPINTDGLENGFFWRVMNCWGWATWSNRWQHFDKNPQALMQSWQRDQIKRFNLNGACDFWSQVKGNYTGRINTWAIFWYANIFENNGLCLNPGQPFVQNIGLDGSGENCDDEKMPTQGNLAMHTNGFPKTIYESDLAIQRISSHLKNNSNAGFFRKILVKLKIIMKQLAWKQ
ncbi:MAG: glycosyltransferase [Pseudomonadales bacterium]|nr:glycosyltransferase [Pseudomonadales bacterium]